MNLVRFSIEKPVTVVVGVILVVLFGWIGLTQMPYQLSPTVIEPEISVTTIWPGATPYEVEREIIEEQEKALKGVPGLVEMESSSFNSQGTVTLKFRIGTDVDDALLRVSNKLNEVPSYPENVDKPVITATGAATSPVIWMVLKNTQDNPRSPYMYRTYFENHIRQYLERTEGVADLFVGGGIKTEMHIVVQPVKLAAYGLTITDLINLLRTENINVSAGILGVGRRDYRIRAVAEFKSPEDIADIVIRSTGAERIRVADVATVGFGYEKLNAAMLHMGKEGIAIGVKPEPDANILELTDRIENVVNWLNAEKLAAEKIYLDWVYDQRPYIRGAINLVRQNILLGGTFAIIVLLIFLRSFISTIVVAAAIPISIIGTFIFMNLLGRNLNVVSLAGIAFAVGMLIDSAIVVLENIDRHRGMGKAAFESAYHGTREVWGAILASTLTTVAVFLPVVFMEEEAGQLFRDIAIAVTFAVALSLFASVSVIPMFSRMLFALAKRKQAHQKKTSVLSRIGNVSANSIMWLVKIATKNWLTQAVTVVGFSSISIIGAVYLFPKMEYLPQGNRNLVINILIPPPGLSFDERKAIGEYIYRYNQPYFGKDHNGFPGIKNMFYVGADQIMLFGAISTQEQRAGELVPLFTRTISSIPGMYGISIQAGVFQTSLGRGRSIEIDVSGDDIDRIVQVAGMLFGAIKREIPDAQIRPVPSLELLFPEVRLIPDRDRLKAAGMSARDFGLAVDVLMDGRAVGEFKEEGQKKIDLILKASEKDISTPEELYHSLIAISGGKIIPVSSLSAIERTAGITQIRHLERQRTITLQVTPPFTIPLQEAMEIIETKVVVPFGEQGRLKDTVLGQSGVADKLSGARQTLQWDFILAAVIAYLLMAALFGNFIYPLVIMFTLPLAAVGGLIGLKLVNIFITDQPLDILTMLGFVILVGVVVNNAILIVHQALNNIRYNGMPHRSAVLESTRTRLRPIYMSAATSIFGMLPLVLIPGPGSEFYRGLGSVVLGGLAVSTVFTVFVIPALLMFFIRFEKARGNL
ncbi:MAG: efflux RND transporter permease subunit [Desulfobacterales bacterium]|nr:MAG: efflux RND transporter permease subunit [Desulfobacterales bacterium]